MATMRRRRATVVTTYTPESIAVAFSEYLTRDEPSEAGELPMFCPLCEERGVSRSPSASINPAEGKWHCLGKCGEGGTIAALASELHLAIPKGGQRRVAPLRTAEPSALADQDKPYEWQAALESGTGAQVERLREVLASKGILPETTSAAHVGASADQLSFPVRASGGAPWVQVKFIRYGSRGDKNVTQTPGARAMLYLAERLDQEPTLPVLVCEGEVDALLAGQESRGRFVAVGVTGGAGTVPRDLSKLASREVFVAFDCDSAGIAGGQKLANALGRVGARVHILDLSRLGLPVSEDRGADLSDYFRKYGGSAEALAVEMERLRTADSSNRRERFKVVTAADLAAPVPAMRWLVQGVFPLDSYGVLAGEKKTLKTYTDLALALAVASGQPFLGEFTVPDPQPVLMYLGEGGERPTRRRLQRLAEWMGIDLATLPLRMVFDAGDITGDEFLSAFERAVSDETPGLVIVDPLYAYHPPNIEAQNMYDRGAMLAGVVQMIPEGASFLLADHFRKTGSKELDLDSVAQAGVAAWADSWILQTHSSPPRVDEGEFSLAVQFGSRQWGGAQYTVDWSLGRFDADTGEHAGGLGVAVRSAEWGIKSSATGDTVRAHILALLETEPDILTVTQAQEAVMALARVGPAKVRSAWNALVADERIASRRIKGREGDREVERERWRVVPSDGRKLSIRGSHEN